MKAKIVTTKFDSNQIKEDESIGLVILKRFVTEESIAELAENYRVNDLMIEEVLRQEINKLIIKAYFPD